MSSWRNSTARPYTNLQNIQLEEASVIKPDRSGTPCGTSIRGGGGEETGGRCSWWASLCLIRLVTPAAGRGDGIWKGPLAILHLSSFPCAKDTHCSSIQFSLEEKWLVQGHRVITGELLHVLPSHLIVRPPGILITNLILSSSREPFGVWGFSISGGSLEFYNQYL